MNEHDAELEGRVQELESELSKARDEARENRDAFLRARAELENLRKRTAREVEDARKFALREFVEALLPVKDNLEKGLVAATAGNAHASARALVEGTAMTLRLFSEVLAANGVTEIDPRGAPFDPERHEAVDVRPHRDARPNTVVEVYQKGYVLNGRLIRPARVAVSAPVGVSDAR